MAERLNWLKQRPTQWVNWHPMNGGLDGHLKLVAQLPQSRVHLLEANPLQRDLTQKALKALSPTRWWSKWLTPSGVNSVSLDPPAAKSMDMVWANMHLHTDADPLTTLKAWRQALKIDGVLMFSCLGPDSLLQLRGLYQQLGWPPPCASFTDMHDWGDMLIAAGFAQPVMDVERIQLSYQNLDVLLRDMRAWGRNLHPGRAKTPAPKAWRRALNEAFNNALRDSPQPGSFNLTFEIIYGHAVQPLPQVPLSGTSSISLDDMRSLLAQRKP